MSLQLIETGKALRAANQKGPKTIGHTHAGLQASIPATIESFHLALDELEIDIVCYSNGSAFVIDISYATADFSKVRAKAVLGRDLRELQSKRNQLENPTIQQAETADPLNDGEEQGNAPSPRAIGFTIPETSFEAQEAIKKEESAMEDPDTMDFGSPKDELKVPSGMPSQNATAHIEVESQESIQKSVSTQAGDIQTGNNESNDARGAANPDKNHGLGIIMADAAPSAASEAPVTGGLQGATFDELFDGNNGESDLNFDDFNFSGDGSGNQTGDFGGNGGEFDLSSFGNQANDDNDDPNSLIQGLESFGDESGVDFNLLDMSHNSTDDHGATSNVGDDFGMSGGEFDMALGTGANESTFDDLLEGMDFNDGDDATGGDMIEHGDFDDEFFGLNNDG